MRVRVHSLLHFMDRDMWKITVLPTIDIGRRQSEYEVWKGSWIEFTWIFWTLIIEWGLKKGEQHEND